MRIKVNRDILRLTRGARADLGRRFQLRIEQNPVANPAADPLDPINEADHSLDTIIYGAGVFQITRDISSPQDAGSVVSRKATLLVHPSYEPYFQQAYAVKIGQEKGVFEVIGVNSDSTRMISTITLQARQ